MSSNSQDITTQYIDVSAKLDNLNATRTRVLALYNKTDNISEILQLEQELNRLQYEIDSTTQQKLYYERQSAKATMNIRLFETLPVVNTSVIDPLSQIVNVFLGGLTTALFNDRGALRIYGTCNNHSCYNLCTCKVVIFLSQRSRKNQLSKSSSFYLFIFIIL